MIGRALSCKIHDSSAGVRWRQAAENRALQQTHSPDGQWVCAIGYSVVKTDRQRLGRYRLKPLGRLPQRLGAVGVLPRRFDVVAAEVAIGLSLIHI